jgi:2-polyprenyl-3-methyl-5-hydroxy-6-metoxy-1,4-benzoquinol methylase
MLAERAESVFATDISTTAMQRARERCPKSHVNFGHLDLVKDPIPGRFELVVIMDVLDCYPDPFLIRRLRTKVINAIEPGGYLLLGNTRLNPAVEQAWWSHHFLLRGAGPMDAFFVRHPELERVDTVTTQLYVNSVFRRAFRKA